MVTYQEVGGAQEGRQEWHEHNVLGTNGERSCMEMKELRDKDRFKIDQL